MKRLFGITTAMLTPFTDDRVDEKALRRHVNYLIDAGVDCLYPNGTTGECMLMSLEEREQVAAIVVDEARGRVPVFIQVGEIPTSAAVRLAVHAHSIGADGIGAVGPYYFGAPASVQKEYYSAISGAVPDDFPVYLYNIPQCTTNDIPAHLAAEIDASLPNIVGIKNSTADMIRLQQLIAIRPDFSVMQGCDKLLFQGLLGGAAGGVSGNSNVIPELFVSLYRDFKAGKYDKALATQRKIVSMADILRDGASLASFKSAARLRGNPLGHVRKPLLDLTQEEEAKLFSQLEPLL